MLKKLKHSFCRARDHHIPGDAASLRHRDANTLEASLFGDSVASCLEMNAERKSYDTEKGPRNHS